MAYEPYIFGSWNLVFLFLGRPVATLSRTEIVPEGLRVCFVCFYLTLVPLDG